MLLIAFLLGVAEAGITCADGTTSTCTACRTGCCSGHGGCEAPPPHEQIVCSDGTKSGCTVCNAGCCADHGGCDDAGRAEWEAAGPERERARREEADKGLVIIGLGSITGLVVLAGIVGLTLVSRRAANERAAARRAEEAEVLERVEALLNTSAAAVLEGLAAAAAPYMNVSGKERLLGAFPCYRFNYDRRRGTKRREDGRLLVTTKRIRFDCAGKDWSRLHRNIPNWTIGKNFIEFDQMDGDSEAFYLDIMNTMTHPVTVGFVVKVAQRDPDEEA